MPPSCSVPKPAASCQGPADLLIAVWLAATQSHQSLILSRATSRSLVWSRGDQLLVRPHDPLGRLDQIGNRQPVVASRRLLPPDDLAPAPNGEPPADREHRQVTACLGDRDQAGPQAPVSERTGQLGNRSRAARRQPLA